MLKGRIQWPAWLLDWAWSRQATPGPGELLQPGLRDRVDDLWWRLFLSRYTSWRQDRAYRKWLAGRGRDD
jgi:hypothetical protein